MVVKINDVSEINTNHVFLTICNIGVNVYGLSGVW